MVKIGGGGRLWVALSFISNLSILFFYKYFDFAIENINAVLAKLNIQLLNPSFDILLPVGISFYTFQALSYTMDVYRGELAAEKNIGKYALFVSFFPQLVAGPIERSKNLVVQMHERHYFDYDRMKNGLLLMLWGFFQKLVVADRAALLVNNVFNNYNDYAGFQIVVAAVLFAFQIYCDFAGYSNIAIGAAQIMGFRLTTNFREPYLAMSIREFWGRWHITLSTWFRDYLYIPLGGNRKGKWRKYFNTMITFLVSGLWHGASWNYIVWGGLHGTYQVAGDFIKPYKDKLYKIMRINTETLSFKLGKILTTFILVDIAWIFFRAPGAKAALSIIKRMLSQFNPWIFFDNSLYSLGIDQKDFMVLVFSLIILLIAAIIKSFKISFLEVLSKQNFVFRWVFYYLILFFMLKYAIYGVDYVQTEFIYFQF